MNIAPLYGDLKVPTKLLLLMQCRKKAIKWINGRRFDHYSDIEYFKQKELNILPIKFKFVLNDILMYYKIINLLVDIKLPEHFTFVEAEWTYGTVYLPISDK